MSTELTGDVALVAVGADCRPLWESVVRSDPNANIAQTPVWGDCMREADGLRDATRAYRTADGRHLVLPLVSGRRTPKRLASEASWPGGWGFCGVLGTDGRVTAADVAGILADLRSSPALRISLPVPAAAAEELWEPLLPAGVIKGRTRTHVVDLSGGFETVWTKRFAGTVRSAARKAERRGVTVETDTTGRLLPVFDGMFRESVDRWADLSHDRRMIARLRASRREPYRKFEVVAELLKDACEVHIARLDGRPVAGIIVLTHGGTANYWRGAMDKELVAGTGANELLHKVAVERACARGFSRYDMQRSPSAGVSRFKAKFGAEPADIVEYRFERLPVTAVERRARATARKMLRLPPD